MGPRYSLRRRLLIMLLVPLCTIGVVALFDAYRTARETANQVFDRVLSGSALAIAERVVINDDDQLDVDIPYVALEMLTSSAQDRVFYRIDHADGTLVTGYQRLAVPDARAEAGDPFAFADGEFRGEPIRVATYRGTASTGERSVAFRVTVAETTNARQALAQRILLRTALRQFLLIFAAAIIVWVAVTRSLRPLGRLEQAIGRRSPEDLRPIEHNVPQEVGGLVDRINGFMARLDGALSALRHFTGNASHQLRTPLAIVRTQLGIAAQAETLGEARHAIADCDQAVADAERTLAQLLLLARVDETTSKAAAGHSVDLDAVARATAGSFVLPAARAGFDLAYEGGVPVGCRGDPVLLREMISNLIDNAIRHAKAGASIVVAVRTDGDTAILSVEDDGCGIPAELRTAVMERYSTTAPRPGGVGGLGLAIVNEIAALFEGSVRLASGARERGTRVEVRLRAAQMPA
ncbi:MAG: sensor histidine kinase [Roseitalea sp.]|jgi:two-component system sensor histidine kinase TctE|uniref:histidine kinase n=1 Tax=Oceaniradius stylonematis TaxID=2184161 RepID=A0A3A8AKR1_9HYPH|nr:sensor histidine kinase [Oceaniradius stylonematis]MBO6553196.1 sensor histidine kinase [Roseitalea sp.]MBO6951044.1 sensor histidine kinase [Rhizobiaceae bacterium]RNC93914.1 MAG: sensor histidine kinase [Oricola sp.]MBO6590969.1 sensor histidine kinase [Roseitalea sp.]MBO6599773.1 sensor histidine kinase [Roseitalea sp.]